MVFQKQNMPTSIAKALENRMYDVLMGYDLKAAVAAASSVLDEVKRQLAGEVSPLVQTPDTFDVVTVAAV